MESFITFFTAHFEKFLSREMMVFFLSTMPVIELRGGLIAASLLKVNYIQGLLYCLIGNILPNCHEHWVIVADEESAARFE